jgi:metal-responsive CopG/Arc/MetJ family transcriptional regulator
VANQLTLIQARIPEKLVKKLDKAQKEDGVLTRAEYLRQIVSAFVATRETQKRN